MSLENKNYASTKTGVSEPTRTRAILNNGHGAGGSLVPSLTGFQSVFDHCDSKTCLTRTVGYNYT